MVLSICAPMALGLIAASFTTVAFVPQLVRTWRMKSASDLSLAMMGLNSAGTFLWLIYGLWVHDLPVIVADFAALALVCAVLGLAVRYRGRCAESRNEEGRPKSYAAALPLAETVLVQDAPAPLDEGRLGTV